MATDNSFALPETLCPDLQRAFDYWDGLKRADNSMPFWDDLKLSALGDLASRLFLIDVFEKPQRFRMNTIGPDVAVTDGAALRGKFIDEAALTGALEGLRAQASATVVARAPTFDRGVGFGRILLPMWGDGRIGMLLGAIDTQ